MLGGEPTQNCPKIYQSETTYKLLFHENNAPGGVNPLYDPEARLVETSTAASRKEGYLGSQPVDLSFSLLTRLWLQARLRFSGLGPWGGIGRSKICARA